MTGKMKLGLIGAGLMGRNYLQAAISDPNAEYVAVCDLDQARGRALADDFKIPAFHGDLDSLLKQGGLDAVVVATPDFAHRDAVIRSLEAGLDVLCEKPLATTVPEALDMARATRATGRRLMVNFGNRHRPSAQQVKELLEARGIGDVHYAFMCLNEKKLKTATLSWSAQTSPLWFLLSHVTDFLSWLFAERIVKVYAAKGTRGSASTTTGVLHFANGAVAVMESSWDMPAGYQRDIDLSISLKGATGVVDLDMGDQGLIVSTENRTNTIQWDTPRGSSPGDWWNRSCHYFTRQLASGAPMHPNADEGLAVVLVLSALQKSLDTGAAVTIADEWPEAVEYLG